MSENNVLELHELEELKAAYNLMDERLDGQEIVSDEQLREAMYRKFADIRQNAKEALIWGDLIFVPILAWWVWTYSRLTLLGMIILGVYWVASLIFRFFILRRTKKEDYGSYDLKTLVEKESGYSKNVKYFGIATAIFLLVFFLQMFIGIDGKAVLIFVVLVLILMVPVLIRWLVIKFKYDGKAIDPATGQPRKLGGKVVSIIGYTLFGIAGCLFVAATVMGVIESAGIGWLALLKGINGLTFIMATAVLLLGVLHHRGKITVSRRLLVILSVIAIALSASVAGIATLNGIAELTRLTVSTLMTTAGFSALGLAIHRMRKS
ncbi:MAG: hypothetical protein IKY01_03910 [Prevotella sp.]|nr:hypothetical protein [Prevotella sp.]